MRLRHMNNILRRALLLLSIGLAMPLLAAVPEYLVGATAPTAAPNLRDDPAVASDGTDFFVVWSDWRSGTGGIVGARVKRTGQIVDPLGIRIASISHVLQPNVIWDGGAYLITWTGEEWVDGYPRGRHVYAARVDREGRIVMAPRLLAENATTAYGIRYAASNGTVSVVAYLSHDHRNATRAALLDREGNTIRHETLLPEYVYRTGFTMASTGSRFVVAWSQNASLSGLDDQTIEAIALGSDGGVLGPPVEIGPGDEAAIAGDGSRFTIVSLDRLRAQQQWALTSRTVNADLTQLGATNLIATAPLIERPSLLWRGDRYDLIAGYQPSDTSYEIASFRLDRDGRKIGTDTRHPIGFSFVREALAAATNGADALLVQGAYTPGGRTRQIVTRRFDGSLFEAPQLLSWSGNTHGAPDVAASPSGQLVAWSEDDGVFATRMDRNGNSLDGRGIRLSTTAGRARAAFDGTNYVVAWVSTSFTGATSSIGVRYIAPATGATVAETQISTTFVWQGLALATSPEATFVVYEEGDSIRVVRIPHATHTPDPAPLVVSPVDLPSGNPAAAWNGSHLLVVWTEEHLFSRADPPLVLSVGIYAARVTGGLSLLDPSPIVLEESDFESEGGVFDFSAPSVASNGEHWVVVADRDAEDVIAHRVLRNGTVEANAPPKIARGRAPVVAWDGVRYVVAWYDANPFAHTAPLMVAGIPANGALVAAQRSIAATNVITAFPSIARAMHGEVALVYTKVSTAPEHAGVPRSFLRLIDIASQRGRVVRP